ncbi:MAG: BON domain-containing protein [Trinickia sp.]
MNSGDVHVMTKGGVVKLTGHVASAQQKQKAGDIVQGLDGVTAVQNELTVAPSAK